MQRISEAAAAACADDLAALWDEIGPAGDPVQRCTVAHYLADLQADVEAELMWDERALACVAEVPSSPQLRAFLPSLHLNLADDYRRVDDPCAAMEHLALAKVLSPALPANDYGTLIRDCIRKVDRALELGSIAPLS